MRQKKCPAWKTCRNGADGCWEYDPKLCVRFLPLEGTHVTEISGCIETPPNVDSYAFAQYFSNWIESMGWSHCCMIRPYKEEPTDEPKDTKKHFLKGLWK